MKKNYLPEEIEKKLKKKNLWKKKGEITKEIIWIAGKLDRPKQTVWSWYQQTYNPQRYSKSYLNLPALYSISHTTFYIF